MVVRRFVNDKRVINIVIFFKVVFKKVLSLLMVVSVVLVD